MLGPDFFTVFGIGLNPPHLSRTIFKPLNFLDVSTPLAWHFTLDKLFDRFAAQCLFAKYGRPVRLFTGAPYTEKTEQLDTRLFGKFFHGHNLLPRDVRVT